MSSIPLHSPSFAPQYTAPKPFWSRFPRLTVAITILVLIGVPAGAYMLMWRYLTAQPTQVLGMYSDSLWDLERGSKQGSARLEKEEDLWRIYVGLKLPALEGSNHYHGWLKDPITNEIRYAGELFPVFTGEYSITYTTEENIARFSSFLITTSAEPNPKEPSEAVAEWKLSTPPPKESSATSAGVTL